MTQRRLARQGCKHNYQKLEKYTKIVKGKLVEAKLCLEKLYSSSDKLDEQLQQQKPKGDMTGIGRSIQTFIQIDEPKEKIKKIK